MSYFRRLDLDEEKVAEMKGGANTRRNEGGRARWRRFWYNHRHEDAEDRV